MSYPIIRQVFQPIYGKPCWNVEWGWGSCLTLQFGEPHLVIHEPRATESDSAVVRKIFSKRQVHVRGDWHLWIYMCRWRVFTGDKKVGYSSPNTASKRLIARGARELDGQKLLEVQVDPSRGTSVFTFDLGSRLVTWPDDPEEEQWLIFESSGKVLGYYGDGRYTHQPSNTPPSEKVFKSFELDHPEQTSSSRK